MSLEAAKKVLAEVNKDAFNGKSREEVEQFLKENGYDCTVDEVKKVYILAESLSEDEMAKVTGGAGNGCPHAAKKEHGMLGSSAKGDGSCPTDYYSERCSDTVEKGSSCWSGDYDCVFSGREYHARCLSTLEESDEGGGHGGTCFGIAI